jgi:hypothetical protein
MNKAVGIGIGLFIIAIIVGVAYSSISNQQDSSIVDQMNMNEKISNEQEIVTKEPQTSGREISVEFAESIELVSP